MNNSKKKIRVAVGLSGGVDSALAAALLVEQGYDVTGVFLECWRAPGCRTDEDRKDALDVSLKLEIPFKVLDFKKEYKKQVVDYFYSEHQVGRTPNPDTMCNKEIKFGLFYDWVKKKGFDCLATGHYARIMRKGKKWQLLRGVDEKKDQSYFLYLLRQEQLGRIMFPIGEMTKGEVRKEAKKRKLPVADKPDSQGICFIGKVSVKDFLKDLGMKEEKGQVVDADGKLIGEHDGVGFYTIGQRGGWRMKPQFQRQYEGKIPAFYVIGKFVNENRLIVGTRAESNVDHFKISKFHFTDESMNRLISNGEVKVRIRHGGELMGIKSIKPNSGYKIRLKKPVFGVAEGQAAVFYQGDVVLGGGTISS